MQVKMAVTVDYIEVQEIDSDYVRNADVQTPETRSMSKKRTTKEIRDQTGQGRKGDNAFGGDSEV